MTLDTENNGLKCVAEGDKKNHSQTHGVQTNHRGRVASTPIATDPPEVSRIAGLGDDPPFAPSSSLEQNNLTGAGKSTFSSLLSSSSEGSKNQQDLDKSDSSGSDQSTGGVSPNRLNQQSRRRFKRFLTDRRRFRSGSQSESVDPASMSADDSRKQKGPNSGSAEGDSGSSTPVSAKGHSDQNPGEDGDHEIPADTDPASRDPPNTQQSPGHSDDSAAMRKSVLSDDDSDDADLVEIRRPNPNAFSWENSPTEENRKQAASIDDSSDDAHGNSWLSSAVLQHSRPDQASSLFLAGANFSSSPINTGTKGSGRKSPAVAFLTQAGDHDSTMVNDMESDASGPGLVSVTPPRPVVHPTSPPSANATMAAALRLGNTNQNNWDTSGIPSGKGEKTTVSAPSYESNVAELSASQSHTPTTSTLSVTESQKDTSSPVSSKATAVLASPRGRAPTPPISTRQQQAQQRRAAAAQRRGVLVDRRGTPSPPMSCMEAPSVFPSVFGRRRKRSASPANPRPPTDTGQRSTGNDGASTPTISNSTQSSSPVETDPIISPSTQTSGCVGTSTEGRSGPGSPNSVLQTPCNPVENVTPTQTGATVSLDRSVTQPSREIGSIVVNDEEGDANGGVETSAVQWLDCRNLTPTNGLALWGVSTCLGTSTPTDAASVDDSSVGLNTNATPPNDAENDAVNEPTKEIEEAESPPSLVTSRAVTDELPTSHQTETEDTDQPSQGQDIETARAAPLPNPSIETRADSCVDSDIQGKLSNNDETVVVGNRVDDAVLSARMEQEIEISPTDTILTTRELPHTHLLKQDSEGQLKLVSAPIISDQNDTTDPSIEDDSKQVSLDTAEKSAVDVSKTSSLAVNLIDAISETCGDSDVATRQSGQTADKSHRIDPEAFDIVRTGDDTSTLRELRLSLFKKDGEETTVPKARLSRAMGELIMQDDIIESLQVELDELRSSSAAMEAEMKSKELDLHRKLTIISEETKRVTVEQAKTEIKLMEEQHETTLLKQKCAAAQEEMEKVRAQLQESREGKAQLRNRMRELYAEIRSMRARLGESAEEYKDEDLDDSVYDDEDELREIAGGTSPVAVTTASSGEDIKFAFTPDELDTTQPEATEDESFSLPFVSPENSPALRYLSTDDGMDEGQGDSGGILRLDVIAADDRVMRAALAQDAEVAEIRRRRASDDRKHNNFRSKMNELKNNLSTAQANADAEREKVTKGLKQTVDSETELRKSADELKVELETKIEKTRVDRKVLERAQEEARSYRSSETSLREELERLKKAFAESEQDYMAKIHEFELELASARTSERALQDELERYKDKFAESEAASTGEKTMLEEELNETRETEKLLRDDLASVRRQFEEMSARNAAEHARMEAELTTVRDREEGLKKYIDDLTYRLTVSERKAEVESSERKAVACRETELKEEVTKLKASLSDAEEHNTATLAVWEQERADFLESESRLKAELAALANQLQEVGSRVAEATKRSDRSRGGFRDGETLQRSSARSIRKLDSDLTTEAHGNLHNRVSSYHRSVDYGSRNSESRDALEVALRTSKKNESRLRQQVEGLREELSSVKSKSQEPKSKVTADSNSNIEAGVRRERRTERLVRDEMQGFEGGVVRVPNDHDFEGSELSVDLSLESSRALQSSVAFSDGLRKKRADRARKADALRRKLAGIDKTSRSTESENVGSDVELHTMEAKAKAEEVLKRSRQSEKALREELTRIRDNLDLNNSSSSGAHSDVLVSSAVGRKTGVKSMGSDAQPTLQGVNVSTLKTRLRASTRKLLQANADLKNMIATKENRDDRMEDRQALSLGDVGEGSTGRNGTAPLSDGGITATTTTQPLTDMS